MTGVITPLRLCALRVSLCQHLEVSHTCVPSSDHGDTPRSFSLLVVGKVRVMAAFVCGEDIASRVCIRVKVLQTRVCSPATCLYACPPDVRPYIFLTKLF